MSLSTSNVPRVCKQSKILPAHKSGPKNRPENYRPISILPVLSKVLEKAVHLQFLKFLEDRKLSTKYQFGYRSTRSTQLATTLLIDDIRREVDDKKLVGTVFIDLSRVFDTISHSVLLSKLSSYGVKNNEHEWFVDYLFNRMQLAERKKIQSETFSACSGVPQGSILGPSMFLLFFNDLVDNLNKAKVIEYVDDTVLYYSSNDFHIIENPLIPELSYLQQYFTDNELVSNLKKGKTETMLFGSAKRIAMTTRSLQITCNGTLINYSYEYLGSLLDPTLTLREDFNRSYKKAVGRLNLLRRVRSYGYPDTYFFFQFYTLFSLL